MTPPSPPPLGSPNNHSPVGAAKEWFINPCYLPPDGLPSPGHSPFGPGCYTWGKGNSQGRQWGRRRSGRSSEPAAPFVLRWAAPRVCRSWESGEATLLSGRRINEIIISNECKSLVKGEVIYKQVCSKFVACFPSLTCTLFVSIGLLQKWIPPSPTSSLRPRVTTASHLHGLLLLEFGGNEEAGNSQELHAIHWDAAFLQHSVHHRHGLVQRLTWHAEVTLSRVNSAEYMEAMTCACVCVCVSRQFIHIFIRTEFKLSNQEILNLSYS